PSLRPYLQPSRGSSRGGRAADRVRPGAQGGDPPRRSQAKREDQGETVGSQAAASPPRWRGPASTREGQGRAQGPRAAAARQPLVFETRKREGRAASAARPKRFERILKSNGALASATRQARAKSLGIVAVLQPALVLTLLHGVGVAKATAAALPRPVLSF